MSCLKRENVQGSGYKPSILSNAFYLQSVYKGKGQGLRAGRRENR